MQPMFASWSSLALAFATWKIHFIFDGKLYEQTNGLAMGSPITFSCATLK